jgi:LytS/YehU family sensor histidine kinase
VSDISNNIVIGYLEKKNPEGLERPLPGPPRGMRLAVPVAGPHLVGYVSSSLFIVFLSLGVKVLERQSRIEKMQEEMEKAKLNAELALLKNQISPHFFFNTLNNIYSLIGINAEDSQKAVLKLSKLMRYLLYESEQGKTMLGSEIDFMNNYIDLMKLRMSDKISLSVSFPENYEDKKIPPLLFVPFIENSFKHGISYREKSFIRISMEVIKDTIIFGCVNSLPAGEEKTANEHSGIGLENVRKRLNLLFPGSYDLKISQSDKEYEVILKINFA